MIDSVQHHRPGRQSGLGQGLGQGDAVAWLDRGVGSAGDQQDMRRIAAGEVDRLGQHRVGRIAERMPRRIRSERVEVVWPGQSDHALDKTIGHPGAAQPLPLEAQHHDVVGPRRMAHQHHLAGVAAILRNMSPGPGDGGCTVLDHVRELAVAAQPVAGQHHDIALARQRPADEPVVAWITEGPAAAVDENDHRPRAR